MRVTVRVKGAPLATFLDTISAQAKVNFIITEGLESKRVTALSAANAGTVTGQSGNKDITIALALDEVGAVGVIKRNGIFFGSGTTS